MPFNLSVCWYHTTVYYFSWPAHFCYGVATWSCLAFVTATAKAAVQWKWSHLYVCTDKCTSLTCLFNISMSLQITVMFTRHRIWAVNQDFFGVCTPVTKVLKVLLSTAVMLKSCKGSDYGHSTVGVFEWLKAFAKVRDVVTLRLTLSAGLRWEVNSGFPHMIMHPVRCTIVQYAWNSWMLSCFSPQVEAWKHLQNHKNIGNRSTFLCLW